MPIRILDEALANKIAAGEVIERPASVVKELVENAIDAGATEIEVVIEDAGRKLIQVTDNGCGMSREDAVISLQRHATSKITTAEDLFAIRTLGFRGEALPSIAAVSHLQMTTRPHDAAVGTELTVRGGAITDLREVGCPAGTRIEVRQLFFNTPARLKFLKSDQTETGHIADLLNAISLCHYEVNLRLIQNGRETLLRPAASSMLSHISDWLGRQTAESMAPVALQTPGIHIEGFAGKPDVARANRSAQLFFVNGRRIVNRMLTHALEYPYEGLLAPKRYPAAVLTIALDPEQVDVNVHPAKAEVRFHREAEIHAAVVRAMKLALANTSMVQELSVWQPTTPMQQSTRPPLPTAAPTVSALPTLLPQMGTLPVRTEHFSPAAIAAPPVAAPAPQTGLRAIGQMHGTYLIAEGRDALLVINQHRAHERVIFENLWARCTHVDVQRLIIPVTIHLGHREAAMLDEHLEGLKSFGFDLEPMSGQSYLVRAVPALLASKDPDSVLREVLADMEARIDIAAFASGDPGGRVVEEGRRRLLASIACKAAIKAGKALSPEEQAHLLEQLQATQTPNLCPHGAPIIMTITQYELDRKFLR